MDDAIQTGLRIFFLLFAIVTVVSALNIAVSYEEEYYNSTSGNIFGTYSGWTTYILLIVMFFSIFLIALWQLIPPSLKRGIKRRFRR